MRLDAHGKTFLTISLSEYNGGEFAVGTKELLCEKFSVLLVSSLMND